VEGQNVVFESRWGEGWGEGQVGRTRRLAAELVEAKVDILVTAGTEALRAAKETTSSIPIVTATGGDLVAMGLAASLARPGGNVTGVISLINQLTEKRLELIKQLVPRASRVAILRDPDNRSSALSVRDAERVAKPLGVVVQEVAVRGPGDLETAFSTMKRARADALILGENTRFGAERQRIVDLAIRYRLPMIVAAKEYAEAGALASYGTDYLDLFRRAALYVDKILKGAKPADLPIEQPTKFELVINLKTARALSLTIPRHLLDRADQVIR
jgi:putative ABC transport system substrate-binding protein